MAGRTTAQDVAKAAGVSPATVSLIFHGRPGVKAETREHVLAVARELGYARIAPDPSPAADETRPLLLVIFKQEGSALTEMPFFEHLVRGITDETRRRGDHRLVVTYYYAHRDAQEQLDDLRATGCEGIILLATEMSAADVAPFETIGVPIVLLDGCFSSKPLSSVVIDNYRGAKIAVRHLAGLGHTRIGYLHCSADIKNFSERRIGFLAGIHQLNDEGAGIETAVVEAGPAMADCYLAMREFLARNPEPPTAFFADNDHAAAHCIRALQEHGLRVPDDVSVIGFDDVEFAAGLNPPLTTMGVPKETMGALAVKRLRDLIAGEAQGSVRVCMQPEPVIRQSTCPPRSR